eukprot:PhM_4_TR14120/c0_g1_i1/m.22588
MLIVQCALLILPFLGEFIVIIATSIVLFHVTSRFTWVRFVRLKLIVVDISLFDIFPFYLNTQIKLNVLKLCVTIMLFNGRVRCHRRDLSKVKLNVSKILFLFFVRLGFVRSS